MKKIIFVTLAIISILLPMCFGLTSLSETTMQSTLANLKTQNKSILPKHNWLVEINKKMFRI